MNILFSSHLINNKQVDVCNAFLRMLDFPGMHVDLLVHANKYFSNLSIGNRKVIDEDFKKTNKYDLILAFYKAGVKRVSKYAEKNQLPLVYVISATDIEKEYPDDLRLLAKVLILNDSFDYPKTIFPNKFVKELRLSTNLAEKTEFEFINKKQPKILVDIENSNSAFSSLYQIIPLLNSIIFCEITVLHSSARFPGVFNPNIKLIPRSKVFSEKMAREADIIIGSGRIIETGVGMCKPCIIVGERGFGGMLTTNKMEAQYRTFFQGRIGGEIGEYIPEKLFMSEISDLMELDNEAINAIVQENYRFLQEEYKRGKTELYNLLDSEIRRHKNVMSDDILYTKLKLSGTFQLILVSETDYALTNSLTRQRHSSIEKEEKEILELFSEGNAVSDALKKSGYKEEPEMFIEFTRELLKEKILEIDE
ncbi:MAG TPA: hypothetical protein DD381_11265 [Lentisphaeria bacterium]|nr:MAG: hypothetical protein A2W89_13505 [Bacteroidetes bacterium GWE2_42_39]HBM16908.1 hypothetical protein [Lentisphaeria bacterium]